MSCEQKPRNVICDTMASNIFSITILRVIIERGDNEGYIDKDEMEEEADVEMEGEVLLNWQLETLGRRERGVLGLVRGGSGCGVDEKHT